MGFRLFGHEDSWRRVAAACRRVVSSVGLAKADLLWPEAQAAQLGNAMKDCRLAGVRGVADSAVAGGEVGPWQRAAHGHFAQVMYS